MDADQSLNSTTSPAFEGREAWRQPTPSDVVLSFVHLSDTHINPNPAYNIPEADYTPVEGARALVAQINALPFAPDFVLHTGDIAYNPDPDAYDLAREILGLLRGDLSPDLPGDRQGAIDEGQLAGGVDEIAAAERGHVGRHGRRHLRHVESKFAQTVFNHGHSQDFLLFM